MSFADNINSLSTRIAQEINAVRSETVPDANIAQSSVTQHKEALFTDAVNTVYVQKSGNDSNDGLHPEYAKLTIGSAITYINTQTPSATNRFVIHVQDAGTYTEDLTLPAHVSLEAGDAVLEGQLTMNDDSFAHLHAHYANTLLSCVNKSAGFATSYYVCDILDTRGISGTLSNKVGCLNSGSGGQLFVDVKKIFVSQDSFGVGSNASGADHMHFNVEDLYLAGNNATGLAYLGSSNMVGYVDHLMEIGSQTGTVGVNVLGGEICVTVNEVRADTTYNIAAASTLRMFVNNLIGNRGSVLGTEQILALNGNIQEELTPASGDFIFGIDSSNNVRKYDVGNLPAGSGGGGGTTITFFQVQDNATGFGQRTTGSMVPLAGIWNTPTLTHPDFSWDGTTGILTVNKAGTVEFDISVMAHQSTGSNRTQLEVQLLKNGSTSLVRAFNYSHRNGTQDSGGTQLTGFKDTAVATDNYRVRVRSIGVAVDVGSSTDVGRATYISAKLYS